LKGKRSGNSVNSFSYPQDKEPILKELRVIAAREGKSTSEIIVNVLEEYVKAHSSGNNTFKLDSWQENPGFQAVPTISSPSETWFNYLSDCDKEELTDIAISCKDRLRQIEHFRNK
jgi:hypothetical protein